MATINFQTGAKYSFEVYPAALLRSDFTNVEILGVVSESLARKFVETYQLHANYYPYFGAVTGTPNDPKSYNWVHIRTQSGVETVLGIAWIKPDSVKATDWQTIVATIQTSMPDALNRARLALSSNGFTDVEFELKSSS